MVLFPHENAPGYMLRKDLPETQFRVRMDGQRPVQTDCASHPRHNQQGGIGKDIVISRYIQMPFLTMHPVKDLLFRVFPARHDQGILFNVI